MKPILVRDLLSWTDAQVADCPVKKNNLEWESITLTRMAPLKGSRSGDLCFFFSRDYEDEVPFAQPSVLLTAEPFLKPLSLSGVPVWSSALVLVSKDPYLAMARLSKFFAERSSTVAHLPPANGGERPAVFIHPTAVVDSSAKIGHGSRIGPYCVVEQGVEIGEDVILYSHCVVGPKCRIGDQSVLFAHVTLYEDVELGKRVRLHSNVVIGADGFGYAPVRGVEGVVEHCKIYHLGRVVIGDDVEVGAATTIDRGTLGETRVDRGAKLDNLVHIGHNCEVGEGSIICGCAGLAGNAKVGKFCIIGGQAGIGNHVRIGDRASVGGFGAISKDIPPGGAATGVPQRDIKEHFKVHALLSQLLREKEKNRRSKGSTND